MAVGPPSQLRLSRLRLGLTLFDAAQATESNQSDVSLLERQRIKRPALERRLLAFYRKRQQRQRRTATA